MGELHGKCTVPGLVEGELVISREPISFLGDLDPKTGIIVAENHPLKGQSVKDKIFAFPCGKGSTVGSYVIFQMKKNGVAPKAIINQEAEAIVAVGAIISNSPMITGIKIDNLKTGSKIGLDCEKGIVIL
jgi:predicted aconitase with swiveling domain